ncbi:DUF4333 domain-containing protein [Geodermatophilus nigrescens]
MTQVHDPRYTAQQYAPQGHAPQGHGPYAPPPFPAPGIGAPAQQPRKKRTGAIVGSVVAVLVLAGLGIGAFLLFAPRVLDTAAAEREIASLAQEQAGVTVTGVSCPDDVDLAAGTVTTCTGSLEGQDVTFTVEQTDDEGNVTIESDQVYVPVADVEALLTEQFATEAGLTVSSTCDAGERTVLVAADGLQLTCTVALAEDPSDTGEVLANVDAAGNVTFDAS